MIKKFHLSNDPAINVKYPCTCNIHGVQVWEHNVYFSTLKSNLFLTFRDGNTMSIFKKSATLKSNLMFLMFRDGNTMSIFKNSWPLNLTCFWCSGTGIWCPDQAQWWWVEELVAICQWAGCTSNISLLQEIFHSLDCLSKLIFFPDQPVGQGLVHPQELAAEDQGRELVG